MKKMIDNFLKKQIHDLGCSLNLHQWNIVQMVNYKGKLLNYHRECENCGKEQELKRPLEYHPSKFVWTDIINDKKQDNV